jgi:hypothetical protein
VLRIGEYEIWRDKWRPGQERSRAYGKADEQWKVTAVMVSDLKGA